MIHTNFLINHCFAPLPVDPTNLIILLHGYGSNGENMLMLGDSWHHSMPHSIFYAPDAPTLHPEIPHGFQWGEVGNMDPAFLQQETMRAYPQVIQLIRDAQDHFSIEWRNTYLVGFSQGCFMALAAGLLTEKLCRGILGYSGGVYMDWKMLKATPKDLEIMLVHGMNDTVVLPTFSSMASAQLQAKGFNCECFLEQGLDHSISLHGLQKGQAFLQQLLCS